MKSAKRILIRISVLVLWIGVWEILSLIINSELLLPSPINVLSALASLVRTSDFWLSVAMSIFNITLGCIIGIILGVSLALLTNRFTVAKNIFAPVISVVRAVPVASFIILVYVLVRGLRLSVNFVSVIITTVMVLPIMWTSVTSAYDNIGKIYLDVGKVYNFSFTKRFSVIYIPFSKPYLLNGLSNCVGLAWKAGIAAEVICRPDNTIGKYIGDMKTTIETDNIFAMTVVIIIISLAIEKMISYIAIRSGAKKYDKT